MLAELTTVYTRPRGRSNYFDNVIQAAFTACSGGVVQVIGKNDGEIGKLIKEAKDIVEEWGFKCEDSQFERVVVE
jgi:hypothetical protein